MKQNYLLAPPAKPCSNNKAFQWPACQPYLFWWPPLAVSTGRGEGLGIWRRVGIPIPPEIPTCHGYLPSWDTYPSGYLLPWDTYPPPPPDGIWDQRYLPPPRKDLGPEIPAPEGQNE